MIKRDEKIKMTQEKLNKTLELHKKCLNKELDGKQVD